MKRASLIILCLIVSICGCSKSPELPKNYIANSVEWHDDDMLVYHTEDALYAYQPSDGTTKNLLSEELTGIHWNINDRNSRYIGFSSDKSKYILLTNMRQMIQIYETNTDRLMQSLNYQDDEIYETGWFDNNNVFIATFYSLYIVNIISGEKIQITKDYYGILSQPYIADDYIFWARNINKIGIKLYYNGVRSTNDSSTVYQGDISDEQKVLEKSVLLKKVDEQRFVYLKKSDDGYEGTFLYNIQTGESSLLAKEDLRNTGGVFLTNDGKLAFVTKKTESDPYYGVIFDPVTLQSKKFKILLNLSETEKLIKLDFWGALERKRANVFFFTASVKEKHDIEYKNITYNSRTNRLKEIAGYEDKKVIDMQISPSGKYIVVDRDYFFDVIRSDNL